MTKAKRGLRARSRASISLIVLLAAALCACGGGDSGSSTAAAPSPGAGSPPPDTGNPSPPAATAPAVTLAWDPPTQNTDATPLTDLAGYKIHYGTESQNYTHTVAVANPGLTSYVIDGLAAGTYYFAVTAYNSAGTDSPPSDEVSATVN